MDEKRKREDKELESEVAQSSGSGKARKDQKIRNSEYYGTLELYDRLYEDSLNGKTFSNLMPLIVSKENVMEAFRNIKGNKGSKTPGVDGKTIEDISPRILEELVKEIRETLEGTYKPGPVKRVEIPKPGSDKTRPLGIPCIFDRLIQQCVKQVLEPIAEAKFYKHNYGFRPNRSAKQAISRCYFLAQIVDYHYVVDVDIKGFFDNVNHSRLKQQLWNNGIRDKKLLSIIDAMLKAPIEMPDGTIVVPEKGTPQGGILSPILANYVLNDLDWWIATQWSEFPAKRRDGKDYASDDSRRNALKKSNLKQMYIVRYADDFKVFTPTKEEAEKIKIAIENWLLENLGLETAPEKSGITNLRKKWTTFLGHKFRLKKKGEKYVIESRVADKSLKKIKEKLKETVKEIEHPRDSKNRYDAIMLLNSVVLGFHEFFDSTTEVSKDFGEVAFEINRVLYNRVLKNCKNPKEGELDKESALYKRYGESKQLRFFEGIPIAPIGYVQFKIPLQKNQEENRYTEAGRKLIHKKLRVNLKVLRELMAQPTYDRSIEFCDNRISKFCAQYGECYVLKIELTIDNLHTHHIIPIWIRGPDDSYKNLVLVDERIHKLIHATKEDTIMKYIHLITEKDQLDRLNKLRVLAGNDPIVNLNNFGTQLSFFTFI